MFTTFFHLFIFFFSSTLISFLRDVVVLWFLLAFSVLIYLIIPLSSFRLKLSYQIWFFPLSRTPTDLLHSLSSIIFEITFFSDNLKSLSSFLHKGAIFKVQVLRYLWKEEYAGFITIGVAHPNQVLEKKCVWGSLKTRFLSPF